MSQLVFTSEELNSEHAYASLQSAGGQRMHGGFDRDGSYVPPRSLLREPAIRAWSDALRGRGGDLFDADASLLTGPRLPNPEQQKMLIRAGIDRPFWNGLTITGKIEGRGRVLAEMVFPDLQDIIVEDLAETALGHLNKGLLAAHGIDEGGQPDKGIGGHDVMWFVARDLTFGEDAYPDVEPPQNIARPEAGTRFMPEIGPAYEGMLSFLMNLLMIEFRAEIGFANTQEVLRTPDLFVDRREGALEASEFVERIRTDEEIHVRSLRLYLGELRELTLKTVDGGTVKGAVLIDRFWTGLVNWATEDQPRMAARAQFDVLKPIILAHADGPALLERFKALADLDLGDQQASKRASDRGRPSPSQVDG
ncbi:MAG: hypothetical protein O3A63_01775 [Proteobacteria bacterium]|nr:hypothetical protein [Pseudomonadota bacterium]